MVGMALGSVVAEVESYHSSLSSHVYLDWPVTWVDVGGGCYSFLLHIVSL